MLKGLLKPNETSPIGLDVIRILSGVLIASYGLEFLDPEKMAGYTEWLTDVGMPLPQVMAYIGKLSELIFGSFLALGFITKLSTVPLIITMCVINFIMLDGNLRSVPVYLLLLFACFFFIGSGRLSVDYWLEQRKSV